MTSARDELQQAVRDAIWRVLQTTRAPSMMTAEECAMVAVDALYRYRADLVKDCETLRKAQQAMQAVNQRIRDYGNPIEHIRKVHAERDALKAVMMQVVRLGREHISYADNEPLAEFVALLSRALKLDGAIVPRL